MTAGQLALDLDLRPPELCNGITQSAPALKRNVPSGPAALLRKLVAGGADPARAAALVVALDREARR